MSALVPLGSVASIERSSIASNEIVSGTTYVGLENVKGDGSFEGVREVDAGDLASSKFRFTTKHILYGKLRPYLRKIVRPNFDGICSTDILPILPGTAVDRDYLTHFLRLDSSVEFANSRTAGVNLPRISPTALEGMMLPLPKLEEQRRIAAILDQAEALRTKRRQALAKLDTLTQSLFLEMFGDPAANNSTWPPRCLGELFAETPNYGSMVPPSSEGAWLSLRVGNIQDWRLDLSDRKYIDLPLQLEQRFKVRDGDVLLARAIASLDHLGKCVIAYPGPEDWAYDSHLMRIRLNTSLIIPEYLCTLLQTPGGRSLFLAVTRRSAVQFNINTKELRSLSVPVPAMSLQTGFRTHLRCIQEEEKELLLSMRQLDSLFASLQHRAFNGEL